MENKHKFKPDPEYRLMDQVPYHHYAYKTEQAYCSWILQYIRFYGGKTYPESLDKNNDEVLC
ncbi:phage integrase N-terminal SAM-like domain-containing protein [Desulfococcaceae bacterium HSG9]|nr:phage integrase N-terminal SAM-like domain-containing protein [Desulfococcaceae bacterium HSG9]